MSLNWTSGNGARRIVVVRQGTTTTWTPSDGIAPTGVNASFPDAADQGGGNKICYDGTGGGVTLAGLNPGTFYSVSVFEYNGTGLTVNYLTGGVILAGSHQTQ